MSVYTFWDCQYLERKEDVCSGDVIVKGTRIRPRDIVNYGSIQEIKEDFGLTEAQILECYRYENIV